MLAESLIEEGLRLRSTENFPQLEMVGITGIVSDYAAIQRTKGLKHVVLSYPEIRLRQIVPANWNDKSAATSYAMLSRRYPKVTLIWSASDVMAQGVIRKAKKHGIIPGKDVLIGGVDWAQAGLQAVRSGEQFISIGGHFLEGGWAVVLIYDYLSGSDFAKIKLRWRSKMGIVTAPKWETQKKRLAKIQPDFVDFKRYSRFLNPENTSYDFKLESLFNQQ
jgi:ABC-type sugar transport system substrate-binding protein